MTQDQKAVVETILAAFDKTDDTEMAAAMRATEVRFRAAFAGETGDVPAK